MEELKRRDFWTDREIRLMLSIVHEKHFMQLMDKTKRNRTIFENIANELKKKNIKKNHLQIRNKFKSIKSEFLRAKRNNNKSGARRQISEHFELLDEIFKSHPAQEAEVVDVAEIDCENIKSESILAEDEEISETQIAEEYNLVDESEQNKLSSFKGIRIQSDQEAVNFLAEIDCDDIKSESIFVEDEEISETHIAEETNFVDEPEQREQRGFKRTKKQSYQKVVESFTKEWRESQQDLLQSMKEHDEKLMKQQKKHQEELLEKSLQAMEKILAKDREETAKMLQGFLTALQPTQPTFHSPNSAYMEPSCSKDPLG